MTLPRFCPQLILCANFDSAFGFAASQDFSLLLSFFFTVASFCLSARLFFHAGTSLSSPVQLHVLHLFLVHSLLHSSVRVILLSFVGFPPRASHSLHIFLLFYVSNPLSLFFIIFRLHCVCTFALAFPRRDGLGDCAKY